MYTYSLKLKNRVMIDQFRIRCKELNLNQNEVLEQLISKFCGKETHDDKSLTQSNTLSKTEIQQLIDTTILQSNKKQLESIQLMIDNSIELAKSNRY